MKKRKFEESEPMERLLRLRAEDENTFMLRTSEATRLTLEHYERAKEKVIEQKGEAELLDDGN